MIEDKLAELKENSLGRKSRKVFSEEQILQMKSKTVYVKQRAGERQQRQATSSQGQTA
jgi:hypothetical protein